MPVHQTLIKVLEAISGLGAWGPVLFILLYVLECVFMIPNPIITPAAGVIFGVFMGSFYAIIGSTLGASAAFLISRHWVRAWVLKKMEGKDSLRRIDDFIGSESWKIVMLTRLAPVTPFKFLNYAYGATRVGFKPYFFGSLLGIIPSAFLFAYSGSLLGNLAKLGAQDASPKKIACSAAGLAATAAIAGYITYLAKKRLKG